MSAPVVGSVVFYRRQIAGSKLYRGTVVADHCIGADCPGAIHVVTDVGGLHHVPADLAMPVGRCPKHGDYPHYDGSTGYHLLSCETCDGGSEEGRAGGFVASSKVSVAGAVKAWNDYVDGEPEYEAATLVRETVGGAA